MGPAKANAGALHCGARAASVERAGWGGLAAVGEEEDGGVGCGEGDGGSEGEGGEVGGVGLGGEGGEDDEGAGGAEGGGSDGGGHRVDGAEGDGVEGAAGGEGFDAVGPDFGGKAEGADGFLEEGGFFALRLGQGDGEGGVGELDGQAGEAGAGTEVEEGGAGAEAGGGEEALAEVAADDVVGGADGGEVDALVPFKDEVEVEEELRGEGGRDVGVGGEEGEEFGGGHGRGSC